MKETDSAEKRAETRPLVEAQLMELRRRYDAAHQPISVKVGDLVREKDGLGLVKYAVRDSFPLILWRLVDDSPHDLELLRESVCRMGSHSKVDCVVGCLTDEGELMLRAGELAMLEPW